MEQWDDVVDDDENPALEDLTSNGHAIASSSMMDVDANGAQSSSNASAGPANIGAMQIANLRRRLAPLVEMDSQLADRLSGGISVSGSGKGGVYVRSGWQARTIENAIGKLKNKRPNTNSEKTRESVSSELPPDPMVEEVARLLEAKEEDIHELWGHSTVKHMITKRRLKLDEWSELYVAIDLYLLVSALTAHLQFPQAYLSCGVHRLCSNDWYVTYLQKYAHIFTIHPQMTFCTPGSRPWEWPNIYLT